MTDASKAIRDLRSGDRPPDEREQALDEAARLCDLAAQSYRERLNTPVEPRLPGTLCAMLHAQAETAQELARALRALSALPAPTAPNPKETNQ